MQFLDKARNVLATAAYKFAMKSITGGQMISSSRNNRPVHKEWDTERAIKEGYKSSVYVYKCIDKIGKAAGSVPWKVYKEGKNGTYEPIEGHPLEMLIENPNPFTDRATMIERMTAHLYLAGNSLHSKVRGVGNSVLELWPIDPQFITPIESQTDFISHYEFKKQELKQIIDPKDVIHAMFVDPANPFWGMAPLLVAARLVDTDNEAVAWNKIALANRAIPDGALMTDKPLTRPQWEEAREQLRIQKQGAGSARDLWLLSGGFSFQQFSMSPVEMDFINSRKMTKEEICSTFDVPPPIVGIMDQSIYNNMSEARKIFWEDSVIPYLNKIRTIFNQSLTPDFAGPNEKILLDYDTSGIPALRENEKEQVDTVKGYWSMGVPMNVLNKRFDLGFEEIEGGDIGFIPSGVIPANTDWDSLAGLEDEPPATDPIPPEDPEPEDPEPPEDEDEDEDEPPGGKSKGAAAIKTAKEPGLNMFLVTKGINLDTPRAKAIYWKSMERRRMSYYAAMTKEAKQLFTKEAAAIASIFKDKGEKAALNAITADKNKKKWAAFYLKYYKTIVAEFGKETFSGLKSFIPGQVKAEEEPPPDPEPINFDPWDQEIQSYIILHSAEKVTNVLDFTRQTIAAIILEKTQEGASTAQIAKAIRDRYEDMGRNRPFTIARTEVCAASNYGTYAAGLQASQAVPGLLKTWVESGDERVRDSHQFRESIPLDEKFRNGLLYPGDMENGKGKDVIKCRCAMSYKTK